MTIAASLGRWFASFRRPVPLGRQGEAAAERFLRRLGYKIVGRRDRDALGELDLVAVDGRTIVFVEVKTRRTHQTGHPAEAVDARKQQHITRRALAFLKRHDLLEYATRFDVIAVTWPADTRRPTIEHIRHAFTATGKWQMFS